MSVANFLNHTADLQTPTDSTDSSAGVERAWATALTAQPIRVEDASAKEISNYANNGVEITHRLFCLTNTPTALSRWVYDGRYFLVKEILRRRMIGNVESFWVNMCQEIAPNG